ncbi:hypothetical protein FEM48_Zijuj07G0109500 [Ziziphus jujuba var. spinosa]|uniref:Uncharacterized protein n=1 Tax=Ziziphus jujuba var. spinosa TaxID=714518 RepID=A0A978V484_ZIZJJ|nr:hypothetical protein FEM48_Zijuj07G0109500 [Ziziphus jujuba var. spinosa]
MSAYCVGKYLWPELVGKDGKYAVATIDRENPSVKAMIVLEGSVVTQDFRCDRVWVWVNAHGIVKRVPFNSSWFSVVYVFLGKRSSWPELLGKQGQVAEVTIKKENPYLDAIIVEEGFVVPLDYHEDRVWIWVNKRGIVIKVPLIGKSSWPELVGKGGKVAEQIIERENPLVDAIIVEEGTIVPVNVVPQCDRVWVWVNNYGIVTRVPVIGKSSWPELVGKEGTVAEETIEREKPLVDAIIVDKNATVTPDFRCDRVWVWVNTSGIVVKVPTIG